MGFNSLCFFVLLMPLGSLGLSIGTKSAGGSKRNIQWVSMQRNQWKPEWRGGEHHFDVSEELKEAKYQSNPIFKLLEPTCKCEEERWDQYVVCKDAFPSASKALSFGIKGHDPWADTVSSKLFPRGNTELFDCFNTNAPKHFNEAETVTKRGDFHSSCLVGSRTLEEQQQKKGTVFEGKNLTTLEQLIKDSPGRSVLMKMDIERSEWDVLPELSQSLLGKISSLHVEYHFSCPTKDVMSKALSALINVNSQLQVVDAAAGYWGDDCFIDNVKFPKMFAVSYATKKHCNPK